MPVDAARPGFAGAWACGRRELRCRARGEKPMTSQPGPRLQGRKVMGMPKNLRMTGAVAASDAARVLSDPAATGDERSAAASALSQAANRARETRAWAASEAGRVLRDPAATGDERSAAASA